MNNYGEVLEDGSIKFVRLLPGPIDRVWSWIANGEKRARWFCGGSDLTNADATVRFEFKHQNLTPHNEAFPEEYKEMEDGISFEVEVTLLEPPHKVFFNWAGEEGSPSVVEFYLSEENGKVRLELIQRGDITSKEFTGSASGWHTHLDILGDKLADKEPEPFWSTLEALADDYKKMFEDHLARLK
ncbi:MAG: ATPase [Hyphococcus sp.]|nr:MAG: ATPase [Marinicaulis sp.]